MLRRWMEKEAGRAESREQRAESREQRKGVGEKRRLKGMRWERQEEVMEKWKKHIRDDVSTSAKCDAAEHTGVNLSHLLTP
jgi:hypothetical protein